METADVFKEIDVQLAALPEKAKQIFLLSRSQQLSITEIAQKLNQLHIALKALRYHIAMALILAEVIS